MSKIKEFIMDAAEKYNINHPGSTIMECIDYVTEKENTDYWSEYEVPKKFDPKTMRSVIKIQCSDKKMESKVLEYYHGLLRNSNDYKESRICINTSKTRGDISTMNEVHIYIFKEVSEDVFMRLTFPYSLPIV